MYINKQIFYIKKLNRYPGAEVRKYVDCHYSKLKSVFLPVLGPR